LILIGALALTSAGFLTFKAIHVLTRADSSVPLNAEDLSMLSPWLASLTQFVTGHTHLIAALALVEALLATVTVAYLFFGRPWARLGLELLCWLELALLPLSMVYVYAVRQILLGWDLPQIARLAGTLPGTTTHVSKAIALGVVIALLRSQKTRN
jgi:hypothetical protein